MLSGFMNSGGGRQDSGRRCQWRAAGARSGEGDGLVNKNVRTRRGVDFVMLCRDLGSCESTRQIE